MPAPYPCSKRISEQLLLAQLHRRTRMFAKRKPRPQESEELVPHGLVWQAMAEPSVAEKANNDAAQTAKEARLAEVHPKQDDAIAKAATGALVPKKPAASSPPLFWRSQKIARPEIVKPMAPVASSVSPQTEPVLIQPIVIQPVPNKDDAQVLQTAKLPAEPEPALDRVSARLAEVSHEFSERRKAVARVTENVRRRSALIGRSAVVWFKRLRERLPNGHRFSDLHKHIDHIRNFMVAQTRAAAVQIRPYSEKFRVRTGILFASLVTYARRQAGCVRSLPAETRQLAEDRPTQLANPGPRKSKHAQVRIRLAGLPLQARILLARTISEWKLKRELSHDSRLWTSMAMAALSALLALGLISTVRHYATDALPSHLSHADSSPVSNLPPAAKVAPQKPAANRVHPVQRVSQPRLVEHKRIDRVPVIKPKPRHSEDDDYVARDTYVYYGNKPNGSR